MTAVTLSDKRIQIYENKRHMSAGEYLERVTAQFAVAMFGASRSDVVEATEACPRASLRLPFQSLADVDKPGLWV